MWSLTDTINYVYDGMLVVQMRGASTSSYTRGLDLSGSLQGAGGIGGLLAQTASSAHSYYHSDGNGSVTYLMKADQSLGVSYRYDDAYGNVVTTTGTLSNPFRFSSKEWLPRISAYYYGYRFYYPSIQRWLNRDPVGEDGGVNLYSYVFGNPVNFNDPLGLDRNHNSPPSSEYLFPKQPPPDYGSWDDGFTECWMKCMLGLKTAVHVAQEAGGNKIAAGAYYHFTDRRFKAWGGSSKVLVPNLAKRFGLPGWIMSACESWRCASECWKETSGADPEPPPPYVPLYPPSWPGRGHNAPPVL
jgi:RHS repeat-associated protein